MGEDLALIHDKKLRGRSTCMVFEARLCALKCLKLEISHFPGNEKNCTQINAKILKIKI